MGNKKSNIEEIMKQTEMLKEIDSKDVKKQIHARIVDARNDLKDITNAQLADILGVADNQLSAWLDPKRNTISFKLLIYLHNYHHVDLNRIICGDSGINEDCDMQELRYHYDCLGIIFKNKK